jgi:hypothetical protein
MCLSVCLFVHMCVCVCLCVCVCHLLTVSSGRLRAMLLAPGVLEETPRGVDTGLLSLTCMCVSVFMSVCECVCVIVYIYVIVQI